ncbi:nucleotide-binding protein [Alphaproteobacteria bacterium]|nr:nucleotide-binding protein [Alphaproteobacteria bacterium]
MVVTGMSGAGKTLALKNLEDLGYEAVDNIPLLLLPALLAPGVASRPLAVGIDIRTRDFGVASLAEHLDRIMAKTPLDAKLLFIDCDDEILRRRYTETRRRHPLTVDRPLEDGIHHERELLAGLRERADFVIDTTTLPPAELKRTLALSFKLDGEPSLTTFVVSFSYRQGLPREADLVFDARFLDNPYYESDLRALDGRNSGVAAYVGSDPGFNQYFDSLTQMLEPLLPRFAREGKSYLTIAIGCTGGRHRSVVVAERLFAWLKGRGLTVGLRHRELEHEE